MFDEWGPVPLKAITEEVTSAMSVVTRLNQAQVVELQSTGNE